MFTTKPVLTEKAPVQLSFEDGEELKKSLPTATSSHNYNVWYSRWQREGAPEKEPQSRQVGRCDPGKQSGLTKADLSNNASFCLFFARSICGKGWQCRYLHRVPTLEDQTSVKTHDCFGRVRPRSDDPSGFGSYEKECRCLLVTRVGDYDDKVKVARKHFEVFGDIQDIKSVKDGVVLRYTCRLNAEFAKEAMNEQALDKKEVLSVRWVPDNSFEAVVKVKPEKVSLAMHIENNKDKPAVKRFLEQQLRTGDEVDGKKVPPPPLKRSRK